MPRIPVYERQRGIAAGPTGPQAPGGSPIGEALGVLGKAVATFAADRERLDGFEDERRYEALKESESKRFLEAQTGAQPGARDFTKGFMGTFEESARRYVDETPEQLRPKAELRVAQLRRSMAVGATQWELNERERYLKTEAGTLLDKQLPTAAPDNLDATYARGEEIIRQAGLPPIDADAARRVFRTAAQQAALGRLPPAERLRALGAPGSLEERLVQEESSGDAGRVNDLGYAGLFQFGGPRLADLGLYKPGEGEDLKSWKKNAMQWGGSFTIPGHPGVRTFQEFLASPEAQRTAFRLHIERTDQDISRLNLQRYVGQTVGGVSITRDGIRAMMHLAGAAGTQAALESGKGAADKNGKTAFDYARMMTEGGQADPRFSDIPSDQRVRLGDQAERERDALDREARVRAERDYETRRDALAVQVERRQVGVPDLDTAYGDGQGWLRAPDYVRLRNGLEQGGRADRDLAAGLERLQGGQGFNPYDPAQRRQADAVYEGGGGIPGLLDPPELSPAQVQAARAGRVWPIPDAARNKFRAWVGSAGMVPQGAAVEIRRAIASNDPSLMARGLQLAAEALRVDPRSFAGQDGAAGLVDDSAAFQRLVEVVGLKPEEAARRMAERRDPAQKERRRISDQEADKWARKNLSVDDLIDAFEDPNNRSALNPWSWFDPDKQVRSFWNPRAWWNDNSLDFSSSGLRGAMEADYREVGREAYLERGDADEALGVAMARMRELYGISRLTGELTLMKFPPEQVYPAVGGSHDYVMKQAQEAIRDARGFDVAPADVQFRPIPETEAAIRAGRPAVYELWFFRPDPATGQRILETLPGVAFFADPGAAAGAESSKREQEVKRRQEDLRKRRENTSPELGVP